MERIVRMASLNRIDEVLVLYSVHYHEVFLKTIHNWDEVLVLYSVHCHEVFLKTIHNFPAPRNMWPY